MLPEEQSTPAELQAAMETAKSRMLSHDHMLRIPMECRLENP